MFKYIMPEANWLFKQGATREQHQPEKQFPPYNVVAFLGADETTYEKIVCEFSVAGYSKDELEVTFSTDSHVLSVSGSKKISYPETRVNGKGGELPASARYLHRGIAARHFSTKFSVGEDLDIGNTSLENGILSIELNYVMPKDKNEVVKKIFIN